MSDSIKKINQDLEKAATKLPLASKKEDIVPGEGNEKAQVLLIGEAPGYHESVQRRPFVGRSGQLLRKVLKEVGLTEEEVFISNIVKARPPENRDPTTEEIQAYKPFLDREIEVINPQLIVTLGRFSMNKFLPGVKISVVHGRLHRMQWNDTQRFVLPMYHPAAALRGTRVKNMFIADFEKVKKIVKWLNSNSDRDLVTDIKEALF